MGYTDLSSSSLSATATLDAYLSRGSTRGSPHKRYPTAGLKREQTEPNREHGVGERYAPSTGEASLGQTARILRMVDGKGGANCLDSTELSVSERIERIKRELGEGERTGVGSPGKLLGELALEKDLKFSEASQRVRAKGRVVERGSGSEVRDSARAWCKERDKEGNIHIHQDVWERNTNWTSKSPAWERKGWGGAWETEEGLRQGWSSSGKLQSRLEALREKASDRLLPGDKNTFRARVSSPRSGQRSCLRWKSTRTGGKEKLRLFYV